MLCPTTPNYDNHLQQLQTNFHRFTVDVSATLYSNSANLGIKESPLTRFIISTMAQWSKFFLSSTF